MTFLESEPRSPILQLDQNYFSVINSSESAKLVNKFISDKFKLYSLIEQIKNLSYICFFRYHFEYETFHFVFPKESNIFDIVSLDDGTFTICRYKEKLLTHYQRIEKLCNINSKFALENVILVILTLHYFDWQVDDEWEPVDLQLIDKQKNKFLSNLVNGKGSLERYEEIEEELRYVLIEFLESESNFFRHDIHSHDLPKFRIRKKPSKKQKNDRNEKESLDKKNSFDLEFRKEVEKLKDSKLSWFQKYSLLKKLELNYSKNHQGELNEELEKLNVEFQLYLDELELVDGYGSNDDLILKEIVDSIVFDQLANRSSNKLIVGPQGTGKSSFSLLLSRLMKSKLIIIECGPLTDNNDFYGSYEIHVEESSRQAITTYSYNGFMHASKLVNDGEKVVVCVEEYNLLASETLLKQLNRFFQDRIISSMGGKFEIDNQDAKNNLIIILTGNHEFGQDWLEDVGLARRFDFFEMPLPSTGSVAECLYKFVKSQVTGMGIPFELAERIAEIRDDLVASLNEKSIRPLLSHNIRYPDLFTLRNFTLDLIHGVSITIATKRWITKIILGGVPLDSDLREQYTQFSKVIQRTIEDRLPSNYQDLVGE